MSSTLTDDPILPLERARVFFDGFLGDIRLDHPEGVAVDPDDGSIWCGGEAGQIYQISPDGKSIDVRAQHQGGLTLAVVCGPDGLLYWVDLGHRAVHRMDRQTLGVETFVQESVGERSLVIPNAVAFDSQGYMYLSDSHSFSARGPGLYRIRPDGKGELWSGGPFSFANGVAVAPDDSAVYVAESTARCITRIPVRADGSAGEPEVYVDLGTVMPDGVCFGPDERLYIACYVPCQVMRVDDGGDARVLIRDDTAHTLAHPTNADFRGPTLFTANLGRWHITAIETGLA